MRTTHFFRLKQIGTLHFFVVILAMLALNGCMLPWDHISGSGTITSETYHLSGFDAVRAGGVANVYVTIGDQWLVEVTTDDNLHEFMIPEVEGSKLIIKTKEMVNLRPSDKLIVQVVMPALAGLYTSGSSNCYVETPIEQDHFAIRASGSSDVYMTLYAEKLEAAVSGSSDIHVKGFAKFADVSASGSSDFRGEEFTSDEALVNLSGSSSARLTANNRVKGNLSGSSDLYLSGSPEVSVSTSGSASVRRN